MATVPAPAEQAAVRLSTRLGSEVLVASFAAGIEDFVAAAPMSVLTTAPGSATGLSAVDDLVARLAEVGLHPEFTGRVRSQPERAPDTSVAVLRGAGPPAIPPAPEDFHVVAVIAAFNEEDVIEQTIRHLNHNGVDVYLIDNWSSDTTLERALQYAGSGLIGSERFPPGGRNTQFRLSKLLRRVEQVASDLDADWVISNDADEFRSTPWAGVSLRDGLHHVRQCGFTAVNHSCLNFALTQDTYEPESALGDHLQWFSAELGDLSRVNAWDRRAAFEADLAWSGGHQVRFRGRRIFPYNFLIRHYPIRSIAQGQRKVFTERLPRFPLSERLKGWHGHYDHLKSEFMIQSTAGLCRFDMHFDEDYLIERLTGVGWDAPTSRPSARLRVARTLRRAGLLEPALRLRSRMRDH